MKHRIKEMRKAFNLTQQEFADRVGIKQSTVATYEIGRNDPSDAVIALICKEFNVSETWLRTGEGPMTKPVSRDAEIDSFINSVMKGESDDFRRRLVAALAKLDSKGWEVLEKLAQNLATEENQSADLQIVKKAGRDGSLVETAMTGEERAKQTAEYESRPDISDNL